MKKLIAMSTLAFTLLFTSGCLPESENVTEPIPEPDEKPVTKAEMQLEPKTGDTIATLKTNMGDIKMIIYTETVPETSKNFIELAKAGKYEGVIFHRVIKDFMIQTGDFENHNGTGGHSYKGPGTYLEDEFIPGLEHLKGAVSMAKTPYPDTGGSQFFIVQAEGGTPHLNGQHAIFGYAYEGMDVVDAIAAVETGSMDKPVEDVTIESVEISTF